MPASWKTPVIDTEHEDLYDSVADMHSFNPLNTFIERPKRGRSTERSTVIMRNENGRDSIVKLINVETQTEELSIHGVTALIDDVAASKVSCQKPLRR